MDKDEAKGAAVSAIGKAQEALGEAAGDVQQRAKGLARQAAGAAESAYGEASDTLKEAVHNQPATALLIAGAIGFALGLLTFRTTRAD